MCSTLNDVNIVNSPKGFEKFFCFFVFLFFCFFGFFGLDDFFWKDDGEWVWFEGLRGMAWMAFDLDVLDWLCLHGPY